MTKKEYAEYQQAVQEFMEREGIQNLSMDYDKCEEPYFSWRWCDCCGDRQGGNRVDANGWNPTLKQVQEYSVCEDCVYYYEYGELDNRTMMEIEQSEE